MRSTSRKRSQQLQEVNHGIDREEESLVRWSIPLHYLVVAALKYFLARRKTYIYLTLILKLRTRSRTKEQALLQAISQVTNMTAHILELLQEDPSQLKKDGAFACVYTMLLEQQQKMPTAKHTKESIDNETDDESAGGLSSHRCRRLAAIIQRLHNHRVSISDYPLPSTLRLGVFRASALMVLLWYQDVLAVTSLASSEQNALTTVDNQGEHLGTFPAPDEIHRAWAQHLKRYEAASKQLVPFGRHSGKPLTDVKAHQLRLMLERCIPEDVANSTLHYLEVLLFPTPETAFERETAKEWLHPYKAPSPGKRTPRATHLDQNSVSADSRRVTLGELAEYERHRLYDELVEMRDFAKKLAAIRDHIEVYIYQKPPHFPTVDRIDLGQEAHEKRQINYAKVLTRLQRITAHKTKRDRMSAEYLHALDMKNQHDVLRAEAALESWHIQPLSFVRTMRPKVTKNDNGFRGFSLVYDEETYEYLLVLELGSCVLHPAKIKDDHRLFFVNFPGVKFDLPKTKKAIIVPIECGRKVDEEVLRQMIRQQAIEQQPLDVVEQKAKVSNKKKALVKSRIGTLKIMSTLDEQWHPQFFAHLPVRTPIPACNMLPEAIIGFHEHKRGYSYAVLDLNGICKEVGDLPLRTHTLPKGEDAHYSDNYVFEVASAMIALAVKHNAYVVVEDTEWKKQVSTSRRENQEHFARPSAKIFQTLQYKALLAGLLNPRTVYGVKPSGDCGACMTSHTTGSNQVVSRETTECFLCQAPVQPYDQDERKVECIRCYTTWWREEAQSTCEYCGVRQLARFNTAIVVAQKALFQMVKYYATALARKEGYKKDT